MDVLPKKVVCNLEWRHWKVIRLLKRNVIDPRQMVWQCQCLLCQKLTQLKVGEILQLEPPLCRCTQPPEPIPKRKKSQKVKQTEPKPKNPPGTPWGFKVTQLPRQEPPQAVISATPAPTPTPIVQAAVATPPRLMQAKAAAIKAHFQEQEKDTGLPLFPGWHLLSDKFPDDTDPVILLAPNLPDETDQWWQRLLALTRLGERFQAYESKQQEERAIVAFLSVPPQMYDLLRLQRAKLKPQFVLDLSHNALRVIDGWLVLEQLPKRGKGITEGRWWCQCVACGTKTSLTTAQLKTPPRCVCRRSAPCYPSV